ncbi:MAG: hypothetical protein KBD24_00660 [Candidatus Pacebacteria bacterium]|nr:hypothetical protein [Candidatus Paceibacterota bacterium]
MKTKYTIATLGVVALLVAGVVWAAPVAGATMHLYTTSGFVEMLIEKGVVPEGMAERARAFARFVTRGDDAVPAPPAKGALNADKVSVSVSQYIAQANRTYEVGKDVTGLLLTVRNSTEEAITLEAKRGCQVVYRIFSDKTLVYDSAGSDRCTNDEKVTYTLPARGTRMFEIIHKATDYPLPTGEYRVEMEYPGYGKGERTITIMEA